MMDLKEWIGRSETVTDIATATPYAALSATLDRAPERPPAGTPLPALWHWLYFLPLHRQSEIGPDGHAKRGGFLPPVPLPRRMWAGSQFEFHKPLCVGDTLTRVSTIAGRDGKERPHRDAGVRKGAPRNPPQRRTGHRADRIPRHRLSRGGEAGRRGAAAEGRADQCDMGEAVGPDDVLLFRYSALTFNGHRIHYDRRYVTEVEGYPGLIVHGPMIATLLLDLLRHQLPDAEVARYEFRAVARCSTSIISSCAASRSRTARPSSCGRRTTKAG